MKKLTKKQRHEIYLEMVDRFTEKLQKEYDDHYLCNIAKFILDDLGIHSVLFRDEYMCELLPELADFVEWLNGKGIEDEIDYSNNIRQTILAFCLILTEE